MDEDKKISRGQFLKRLGMAACVGAGAGAGGSVAETESQKAQGRQCDSLDDAIHMIDSTAFVAGTGAAVATIINPDGVENLTRRDVNKAIIYGTTAIMARDGIGSCRKSIRDQEQENQQRMDDKNYTDELRRMDEYNRRRNAEMPKTADAQNRER